MQLGRDDSDLTDEAVEVAWVLVTTLRDVYGVPAPSFLVASGYDGEGDR